MYPPPPSGERCNQQSWWSRTSNVTPTSFFFLHVPVQWRKEYERGRKEFVNKWEKEKIGTNRNSVHVDDCIKGWVVQAWFAAVRGNPRRVCFSSPQFLLSYRQALEILTWLQLNEFHCDRNWYWPQLRHSRPEEYVVVMKALTFEELRSVVCLRRPPTFGSRSWYSSGFVLPLDLGKTASISGKLRDFSLIHGVCTNSGTSSFRCRGYGRHFSQG
jgi:hypothetical protein